MSLKLKHKNISHMSRGTFLSVSHRFVAKLDGSEQRLTAVAAAPAKAPAKACCRADKSEEVASKLLSFSLPIMLSWIVSYTCRKDSLSVLEVEI